MFKKLLATATFAFAMIPMTAHAQPYIGGAIGAAIPADPCIDMKTNRICVDMDSGHAASLVAGYDFGAIRIEVEGAAQRASVARIFDPKQSFNSEGSQARQSLMLNALIDVPMSRRVTGYFGGGGGISLMQMRATKPDSECREPLAVRIVNGSANARQAATGDGTCRDQGDSKETGLTWQAIVGFDYAMGKGWSIGPQARYIAATGIHTAAKSLRTRETRFRADQTYTSVNAMLSLRKTFGRGR